MDNRPTPSTELSQHDLPMLVWLRDDSPAVEEFSMDADQVMDKLGIKRSRLTQISGKELRVGRRRVDRYIRPFYRPQDVEAYYQWSRAPLSQGKPSKAIEEVVHAVQNQTEVSQTLQNSVHQKLQGMEESLLTAQRLQEKVHGTLINQEMEHQRLRQQTAQTLDTLKRDQMALKDAMENLRAGLSAVKQGLVDFATKAGGITEGVTQLRRDWEKDLVDREQQFALLYHRIERLIHHVDQKPHSAPSSRPARGQRHTIRAEAIKAKRHQKQSRNALTAAAFRRLKRTGAKEV